MGHKRDTRKPVELGDEYREYSQASQELQAQFESRLFWLAGGAVTVAIAGAPALRAKGILLRTDLLAVSVVTLLGGLVMAMIGFRVSAIMINRYAEYWHDRERAKYDGAQAMQPWVTFLDWGSLVLVVAGLCCGAWFYLANMMR